MTDCIGRPDPSPRINIAFIIDTIINPTGGTEKQLLRLLRDLDPQRFQSYLVTLRCSEWLSKQTLDIPVITLQNHGTIKHGLDFLKSLSFAKFCRSAQIDIVQTFFTDSNIIGTIGSRLSNKRPAVVSSRRNIGYWQRPRDIRILRLLRHWTNFYLGNSQAAIRSAIEIERIAKEKTHVIYNGIDLEEFQRMDPALRRLQREKWNISESHILIGAIANLRTVKNISLLIDAAARLIPKFPQLRFVVVGDGPERKNLEQQIGNLGLNNRFHLTGAAKDVIAWLAAFDIAVLPSSSESFSNSLLEYMAARLPIVASDVGGNSEAITHNLEGFLCPPGDSEGLAKAIGKLLNDPGLARRFADSGYRKACRLFSFPICIENHEKFYRAVISGIPCSSGS